MLRLAAVAALLLCGLAHGEMDQDTELRATARAAKAIKCDLCLYIVRDIWYQGLDTDGFGNNEEGVLDIVGNICGHDANAAPKFNRAYHLVPADGSAVESADPLASAWMFRPKGKPSKEEPDWRTRAVKNACMRVIPEAESEFAEALYIKLRDKRATEAKGGSVDQVELVRDLQRLVCSDITEVCSRSTVNDWLPQVPKEMAAESARRRAEKEAEAAEKAADDEDDYADWDDEDDDDDADEDEEWDADEQYEQEAEAGHTEL